MEALIKPIGHHSSSTHSNEYAILLQSVASLKVEVSKLQFALQYEKRKEIKSKILVATPNGHEHVFLDEIIYCQATGNYSRIFFQNGTSCLLSKTLKKISASLDSDVFLRCHQSYLINKKYISRINECNCVVESEHYQISIPIARRKLSDLLKKLTVL